MKPSSGKKGTPKRFTSLGIVFAVIGLLLFAYFVKRAGVTDILHDIRQLGAGFLLVLGVSSLRYIVRTLAWTLCFEAPYRLRFRDAFKAYVTGDAMGNLMPLGVVASEPTKAVYVRDRVPLVVAATAVATQNLFYGLSVAVFIFSGTAALLLRFPLPQALRISSFIALTIIVAIVLTGFAIVRLRVKFLSGTLNRLHQRGIGRRWLENRRESTSAVEDSVYSFYSRHRARCLLMLLLEFCFHLAGVLEVYITLYFISDVRPTFLTAYILESVNRIINVVFKFVPLRAGVDEAGSGLITDVLQLGTTSGVSLAIIRKARVIFWTALGVAFLIRRGLSLHTAAGETEADAVNEMSTSRSSSTVPASESR